MFEIISHTPTWVFVVLFTLLIIGYQQSKSRVVKLKMVFVLPVLMTVFSYLGVSSVFGIAFYSLGIWLIGLLSAFVIGIKLAYPRNVEYLAAQGQLSVPGSWLPLVLMMAIFLTKYFVGFAVARELPVVDDLMFTVIISLLYGIFSGVFIARGVVMFSASQVIKPSLSY